MGKIIQFSKRKEENTDTEEEIQELDNMYAEFYEHPEEVEVFYNAPY